MLGIKDGTELLEAFAVILITILYVYLVFVGRASAEGFVILATLVLRKLLLGENGKKKEDKPQ